MCNTEESNHTSLEQHEGKWWQDFHFWMIYYFIAPAKALRGSKRPLRDVLVVNRSLDWCFHCETRLKRKIHDRWRKRRKMEWVRRCWIERLVTQTLKRRDGGAELNPRMSVRQEVKERNESEKERETLAGLKWWLRLSRWERLNGRVEI